MFLSFVLVGLTGNTATVEKQAEEMNSDELNTSSEAILIQENTLVARGPGYIVTDPQILGSKFVENEYINDIIRKYDWNAELMIRIMKAESGGNLNAVNAKDRHRTCKGSYGLMQISCEWLTKYNAWSSWNNAETNIAIAYKVWKIQGYRAWGAYTSRAYLRY